MDKKSITSLYRKKKMTSSEYKSETESNTGSALSDQQLPLLTPLPALLSPSSSPPTTLPSLYTMSRHNINLEQVV